MRNYVSASISLMAGALFYIGGAASSHADDALEKITQNVQPTPESKSSTFTQFAQLAPSQSQNGYEIFAPKTHTLNTRFDYTIWDKGLGGRVISLGPSLRRFANKAKPESGTRLMRRSRSSPYRLEGTRVTFFSFKDKYINFLSDYKENLVELANTHDIQSFSRNEQLAFWINLHNVILIERIAKNHPVHHPSRLLFGEDDQPLHEAKHIIIKGVPLSLKNIRENIVYQNWNNPDVIYGFYRGDIGGPGMEPFAVTADNVDQVLKFQGDEYATSLRGFHTTRKARKISQIYWEAKPYFFPNWPVDVETHFEGYLKDEKLLAQFQQDKPLTFIEYETRIADLWGGDKSFSSTSSVSTAQLGVPPLLAEFAVKREELKRRGLLKSKTGTVVIEDVETEDK